MGDSRMDEDARKKVLGRLPRLRKTHPEKKGRYVTVKEQKKRLKRVVKAKPLARSHMSEAFKAPTLTEEELRITETVLQTVAACPDRPRPAVARAFDCFQCGAKVLYDADRCPRCGSFYIRDLKDEDVEEMLRAEQAHHGALDDIMQAAKLPVVHFDAEIGVMQFLEQDHAAPDIVLECNHCGAAVEIGVERCPICNIAIKLGDTGLAGLFSGMEFDPEPLSEADCPFCGEHVMLEDGACPSCGKEIFDPSGESVDVVRPLVKSDNVVFVHLDIETGALNFVQKAARKARYGQMSMQLDGIGSNGFDQDWSSLSRI